MSDKPLNHIREDNEGLAYECARLDRECKELRQQLEQAESRVAELEDGLIGIKACIESEHPEHWYAAIESIDAWTGQSSSAAFILRKQAEAVEAFGQGIVTGTAMNDDFEDGDFCADDILVMAQSEAARLRQQADQLEKGGE